jgi:CheY-like chemotaxis protein
LRPAFVTLSSLPILIVSQDQAERKELAELVKSWRMLPREADNAAMALQLLTRLVDEGHPLPIVITSNRLPTQDGFLLAFRVKNSPKLKSTAVLLLATDGKPGDAIQCRENGINVYLRQPLSSQQLNEALTAIIGAKDDAEVDATLITRHSLREAKRGNVLIIDHDHDQAMFAAAALKKRDYRVNIVATVADAYAAMAQEDFDVIVVDPTETGFDDPSKAAAALQSHVGKNRLQPKILLASESPSMGESPYDGLVLKPFGKESLTNAIADLGLDANPQKDARA